MLAAMFAASASDALWFAAAVAALVALTWLARRIEPHWVARDGRAFTCQVQPVRPDGRAEGRWRQARVIVEGDRVRLVVRGLGRVRPSQPYALHEVVGRSATPPPRAAVFVLDGDPLWAVRIPQRSRAVAVLDSLSSPR